MSNVNEVELEQIRKRLLQFTNEHEDSPDFAISTEAWNRAQELGKASSKSWIGYHANVYYRGFEVPPAGEHFDSECGFEPTFRGRSNANWVEHKPDDVIHKLLGEDGSQALDRAQESADKGREVLKGAIADLNSILSVYLAETDDKYVKRAAEEIESIKVLDAADIANKMSPKRQQMTRDMRAVQQGTWAPPHVKLVARIAAANQPSAHCKELAVKLEKLEAHFARVKKRGVRESRIGTNIFIGHGRSPVWQDLKDFVQERLRLPYDEFNRIPVAGITNIARLSEMLDDAACAFIIMTAEDELADGKAQARMNVIHEVGLFQGRLGFTKVIVLLEDGCEEFSNIQGLGQIRFPKGNVSAKFDKYLNVRACWKIGNNEERWCAAAQPFAAGAPARGLSANVEQMLFPWLTDGSWPQAAA